MSVVRRLAGIVVHNQLSSLISRVTNRISRIPAFFGLQCAHHACYRLAQWKRDERGTIGMIFAICSFVAVLLGGGAVDVGRAYSAKMHMQAALDAAVLAAGRIWQTENDLKLAEETALAHYNSIRPRWVSNEKITFTADPLNNTITMDVTATISTLFLPLAQIDTFELKTTAQSILSGGDYAENSLEIAMMLDITGSMAGSKIESLKLAAKDLIDIVVWDNQGEFTSKVALVPFADAVIMGSSALTNTVRGALKGSGCTSSSSPCTSYIEGTSSSTAWTRGAPAKWFRFRRPDGGTNTWQASSYCVTERTGSNWSTDAAPNGMPSKVNPSYGSSSANSCGYMYIDPSDLEINTVLPLTSDKELLKRRIDKLVVSGSTAGQMGIAWAWYMLSPKWASVWGAGKGGTEYNTEKVRKIAVLMTDGEFNTGHCAGVVAMDSGPGSGGWSTKNNCNSTNGSSNEQAQVLCSAMKDGTGIRVYTIGFALDGNPTAINTLRECASEPSMFYEVEDGDTLRQAFKDIAIQVTKLRLSQ